MDLVSKSSMQPNLLGSINLAIKLFLKDNNLTSSIDKSFWSYGANLPPIANNIAKTNSPTMIINLKPLDIFLDEILLIILKRK